MAKVTFDLQGRVSYYTLNGDPIPFDSAYFLNGNPALVYHDHEVFYSKRFVGKGVWAVIEEIEQYRRAPEFRHEIHAAGIAKYADYTNRKIYLMDVMPERIKDR